MTCYDKVVLPMTQVRNPSFLGIEYVIAGSRGRLTSHECQCVDKEDTLDRICEEFFDLAKAQRDSTIGPITVLKSF